MNKMGSSNIKDDRNYGIDLLRVFAMFFVVLLHSLGNGGILSSLYKGTFQYNWFWGLEIIAYCAVDIFALISGYVSYSSKENKTKYSNYITIWFEVVFYALIITVLFHAFSSVAITKRDYYSALLPVTNNMYWYFTAFTGLYVLKPFLDKGIRACNTKTLKKLFACILIIFSFFATFSGVFNLRGGYSFIWIIMLYILGSIVKKCNIGSKLSKMELFLLIAVMYIITILYKMYGFETSIFNIKITKDLLVLYTSPTILIASIGYILLFSKIKFNKAFTSIVKFIAPASFAIYLLNTNPLIWEHKLKGIFVYIADQSTFVISCYVIGFSLLFTFLSIIIDRGRISLFKKLKVKELSIKIEDALRNIINKVTKYI